MYTQFTSEKLKARNHLEDLGVDGRIILEIGWEVVNWIHLAYERVQW